MGNVSILMGTIPPADGNGTTVCTLSLDTTGNVVITKNANSAFWYFGATKNKSGSAGYDPRFSEQWFTEIFLAPASSDANAEVLAATRDKQSGADLDLGLSSDYDCTVSSNEVRLIQPGSRSGRQWRSLVVDSEITPENKRIAYEVWLYDKNINLDNYDKLNGRHTTRRDHIVSAVDLRNQIKPSLPPVPASE